jgi:hypothetical protein
MRSGELLAGSRGLYLRADQRRPPSALEKAMGLLERKASACASTAIGQQ